MFLCDIGNTNVKFYKDGKAWSLPISEFLKLKLNDKIFYISVNDEVNLTLKSNPNFIDIQTYFNFKTKYKGIGIDRVSACYSIENGVIIDAGSAITVDIMNENCHKGGFILPGIYSSLKAYKDISLKLDTILNTNVNIDKLPLNTKDAVSYGILAPTIKLIENLAQHEKIFITGGDGAFLSKFFEKSIYKRDLIFDGMKKAIKQCSQVCFN